MRITKDLKYTKTYSPFSGTQKAGRRRSAATYTTHIRIRHAFVLARRHTSVRPVERNVSTFPSTDYTRINVRRSGARPRHGTQDEYTTTTTVVKERKKKRLTPVTQVGTNPQATCVYRAFQWP